MLKQLEGWRDTAGCQSRQTFSPLTDTPFLVVRGRVWLMALSFTSTSFIRRFSPCSSRPTTFKKLPDSLHRDSHRRSRRLFSFTR